MSLPKAFNDFSAYFEEIVMFLKDNQHLYNYANTDVLIEKALDEISIDELEKYNVFDENFNLKDIKEMNETLERIERLKCVHENVKLDETEKEYFKNAPLGPKKKHEINYLSKEINRICRGVSCDTVVDFGCGLGYLDQILFKKYKLNVLGLENNYQCLKGATKRQKTYHKESIDNVKYIKHCINANSGIAIQEYLEENFPKTKDICIAGLHACADLTVDSIDIFLGMMNAKCMVLMPCCYHKMSLKSANMCGNNENQNELMNEVETKNSEEEISEHGNNYTEFVKKGTTKPEFFNRFPLSCELKAVYERWDGSKFLRKPFLRIAAQAPCVDEDLELLVFRLMSRAVLQLYCYKRNQSLVRKRRRAVKLTEQANDFTSYILNATQNGYDLKCNLEACSNLSATKIETQGGCNCTNGFNISELQDLWQHYSTHLTFKKAAILILLQRHLQPVFENFVLFDRIVYLNEKGMEKCGYVKIVNEKISPRCLALVAVK